MNVCQKSRILIEKILESNKISEEEIKKFQEKNYSKKILNLNYPLLRKIDINKNISKQIKDDNNTNRYWKKEYEILNNYYVICSQWYKGDLEYLKKWVDEKKILNEEKNIEKIYDYLKNKGFKYEKNSLANFYLSLKSKPFVILAGISGTGKSKLIELFAESIGAKETYNIISVKPDWTDSTELLGYKDIKGDFIPGILTNIIIAAIKNKDKPYFVCLDEMNLARVEYYLGEYLSLIESRYRKESGEIYTREIFKDIYFEESSEYKDLYFPENLYIIGTVNMDDTTFGFSKKVLDRANTIEFSDVDLADLSFLDTLQENEEEVYQMECNNDFMKTNFLGLKEIWTSSIENINNEEIKIYITEVNNEIVKIHEILKKYSRHFAFRVRDEIIIYMTENKIANLLDKNVAFDYQFMQKVLPIISGSDEQTRKILINLLDLCFINKGEVSYDDFLENIEEKVKLKEIKYLLSANKIIQMLRGYENGYASYWI